MGGGLMEIHPELINGFMHGFGEKLAFLLLSCMGYFGEVCVKRRYSVSEVYIAYGIHGNNFVGRALKWIRMAAEQGYAQAQ